MNKCKRVYLKKKKIRMTKIIKKYFYFFRWRDLAHEIPYAIGEYFSAQTTARSWWRWNVRNDCSLCRYLPFRGCKTIQKIILKNRWLCLIYHVWRTMISKASVVFFDQKFDQKSTRIQLSKGSPWFGGSWQSRFEHRTGSS